MEKTKPSLYEQILIVGIIFLATGLIWLVAHSITQPNVDRLAIAKQICANMSYKFGSYDTSANQITCTYSTTTISEHLNITTQPLEIYIKPDWDYYEGKNESH